MMGQHTYLEIIHLPPRLRKSADYWRLKLLGIALFYVQALYNISTVKSFLYFVQLFPLPTRKNSTLNPTGTQVCGIELNTEYP